MAPLGLRRGCLGCHRLLGLLRGLLQTQASPWQEAQHRHPSHRASGGANHLAALDAAPGLHERFRDPIPPRPACRADRLHGRLGQGSAETAQRSFRFASKKTFPSRFKIILVGREADALIDAPLIRMEGWGPDCHYGRGPAWPAPQRSVWSYHHPSSYPINSPLDTPRASLSAHGP